MALLKVPHFKQTSESSCGAAALSMVYSYHGFQDQTEEVIWKRLKVPRKSVQGEEILRTIPMAKDAIEFELSYFYGQAVMGETLISLQPIKEFLSLSIPVVVCQKISKENSLGHFRVVTGIEGGDIYLNDPLNEKGAEKKDIKEFMELWQKADNDEVVGGEFFAIFEKEKLRPENRFTVINFESSVTAFDVTGLKLI